MNHCQRCPPGPGRAHGAHGGGSDQGSGSLLSHHISAQLKRVTRKSTREKCKSCRVSNHDRDGTAPVDPRGCLVPVFEVSECCTFSEERPLTRGRESHHKSAFLVLLTLPGLQDCKIHRKIVQSSPPVPASPARNYCSAGTDSIGANIDNATSIPPLCILG